MQYHLNLHAFMITTLWMLRRQGNELQLMCDFEYVTVGISGTLLM